MSGLLDRIFPSSGASSQPKDTRTSSPNMPDPESGETGVLRPGDSAPGAGPPAGAGLPGQAPPFGPGPGAGPPAGAGLPGQAPPFGPGPGAGPPAGAGLPGQAPPGGAGAATGGPGSPDEGRQKRKGRLGRRRSSEPEEQGPGTAGRGAPTAGTAQVPVVPEVSLEPSVLQGDALDSPGFASRPKLRRRLRYLRKLRELLLRDLGGFVFDARRFQRPRDDLVAAKIQRLAGIDKEIGALESALEDRRPFLELREPGIGGMCERCGAFFSSTSRFCSECGASLGAQGHSVPAAAGPPAPVAPAAPATRAPARRSSASSTPAGPSPAAPPMSQAARLAAEAAASRAARPAGQPPAAQSAAPQPPVQQPSSGGLWAAPVPKPPATPTEAPPNAQAPGAAPPQGGDPRPQDEPTGPSSQGSGDPLQRQ